MDPMGSTTINASAMRVGDLAWRSEPESARKLDELCAWKIWLSDAGRCGVAQFL